MFSNISTTMKFCRNANALQTGYISSNKILRIEQTWRRTRGVEIKIVKRRIKALSLYI